MANEPSFEDALDNLEAIVEDMESGDLSLEDLMNSFEKGNHLVKICGKYLNKAETRISALENQPDGTDEEIPTDIPESDS